MIVAEPIEVDLDDPRDQVERGAWLAVITTVCTGLIVHVGGLGNLLSDTVAIAIAVVAAQAAFADLVVGAIRMFPRKQRLPVARVTRAAAGRYPARRSAPDRR